MNDKVSKCMYSPIIVAILGSVTNTCSVYLILAHLSLSHQCIFSSANTYKLLNILQEIENTSSYSNPRQDMITSQVTRHLNDDILYDVTINIL